MNMDMSEKRVGMKSNAGVGGCKTSTTCGCGFDVTQRAATPRCGVSKQALKKYVCDVSYLVSEMCNYDTAMIHTVNENSADISDSCRFMLARDEANIKRQDAAQADSLDACQTMKARSAHRFRDTRLSMNFPPTGAYR